MLEWALISTFLCIGGWAFAGYLCYKYKPWTELGKKIDAFIQREKAHLV